MTPFRFRYQQIGYVRWRCRTARRRAMLLVPFLAGIARHKLATAAWRRTVPAFAPLLPAAIELQIGKFVVSEAGDPQLLGHPDIRY